MRIGVIYFAYGYLLDLNFQMGDISRKSSVFKRQPAIHVPCSRRSEHTMIAHDISVESGSQSALMEHILHDRLLTSALMKVGGLHLTWRDGGGGALSCVSIVYA